MATATVILSFGIQKRVGTGAWTTITSTSGSLAAAAAGTYARDFGLVLNNPSLSWTSGSQYRAIVVSNTDSGGGAITAKTSQITSAIIHYGQ